MSNSQKAQNNDDQNQPIDLTKKLEEAQKQASEKEAAARSQTNQTAEDELTKLRAELESMTELAKRTMADLQNVKRRQEEEKRTTIILANADIMRSLLPITDNLQRAFKHIPDSAKNEQTGAWVQGLEICAKQLNKALEEAGLKPIESINQPFNPDLHEALAQGPGPKDTVVEELEKGYTLGDRVIRHSKVKIGNGE